MAYTPENNPYIPGDPYSYDLKWIVQKIRTTDEAIGSLDETIRAKVITALENLYPVVYDNVADMIDSNQSAETLAYTLGYHQTSDGGSLLYFITDDYNDIIGADYYVTIGPNKWALPLFLTEYVTPEMFGALADGYDDTTAIQHCINRGGLVKFGAKVYNFTRLTIKSNVTLQGQGSGITSLVCIDSDTLDVGVSFGSALRKEDDGSRVYRFNVRDLNISAGSPFTGANEDAYDKIIGLNLGACERSEINNVSITGFGCGAIVLSRAEDGSEGLGFVNTNQDGNYNSISNINIGGCGKYAPNGAAVDLHYKANSNTLFNVCCKGISAGGFYVNGTGNNIIAGAVESALFIADVIGSGNIFEGIRGEGISQFCFRCGTSSQYNIVLNPHLTSFGSSPVWTDNGLNRFIGNDVNDLNVCVFPPTTAVQTNYKKGRLDVASIYGDTDHPLYVISGYDADDKGVVINLYNSVKTATAGTLLGKIDFHNSDSSGGAAGESASIQALFSGAAGQTDIAILTGTGTTAAERARIRHDGALIQTPAVLANANFLTAGQMIMAPVSDTVIRLYYKGTDNTIRTFDITLS